MIRVSLPYGRGAQELDVPADRSEVLESDLQTMAPSAPGCEIVARAMAAPVGSPPLEELAAGKKTAVVIISDHTRPVPSREILPAMLAALRRGSPGIKITLLVATGCHRETRLEELREKLGDEIFSRERILIHNCDDLEHMTLLGQLPSGMPLYINQAAAEADLLVAEGFIEPHFFAGYSGGRKSVLPGICARRTVMGNHCAALIDDPGARTGVLEANPIHQDMAAAARMAGLRYIVNVILNQHKQIVDAVAGDALLAHEAGCSRLSARCRAIPREKGDVVVTTNGGAPLDQNVYQAVKSLSTAEMAAKPGAVLIVCAQCADGIGGDMFFQSLRDCTSPSRLLEQLRAIPAEETVPDQWQYQILARILEGHRVIFVTEPELEHAVHAMKMEYMPSARQALSLVLEQAPTGHILVIPDGVSTVVG